MFQNLMNNKNQVTLEDNEYDFTVDKLKMQINYLMDSGEKKCIELEKEEKQKVTEVNLHYDTWESKQKELLMQAQRARQETLMKWQDYYRLQRNQVRDESKEQIERLKELVAKMEKIIPPERIKNDGNDNTQNQQV